MPKRPALRHVFVVALALVLTALLKGALPQVPSHTWSPAGSMAEVRAGASAVLLSDGRVLVTGGTGPSGQLATAELFGTDGSFSAVAPMNAARSKHISVVLTDGRVLVAGGMVPGGGMTNAAEIYNPASNSWSSVAGSMIEARSGHTATLLKDGRILITGGSGNNTVSLSAEIYDPVANQFSYAGSLSSPRSQHAAALLQDGRVLIMGGTDGTNSLSSTDLYDPIRGSVSPGPSLSSPRAGHSATALLNGDVLVAGGNNPAGDLASTEIYDVAAGSFAPLATGLAVPRRGPLAFLLPHNNSVLIVGGTSNGAALASAELYIPWTKTFQPTGAPSTARQGAIGSPLKIDGLLLLAGGEGLASSELYGFATVKTDKDDYAPGEIVTITGTGWQPTETVTLTLVESPLLHSPLTLTAVADARGNISNSEFAPEEHDIGVRFYLTATGASSQAQTTFTDDVIPPTVQFNASSSSGFESVTPANLAVSLSAASVATVTVNYSVTAGTAAGSGTDYTLDSGTLTFVPNDTIENIPITVIDDLLDELEENIVVTLSAPSNATLGAITSRTYTIEDNDLPPTVAFTMTSSSGLESIPGNLAVALSAASGKTVTVDYMVTGGTASQGVDFTILGIGTLTFTPGDISENVQLSVVDDSLDETNETVEVTLFGSTDATLGANDVHTYTILDNDDPPTAAFTLPSSSGLENITPASLAVQLSAASSFTVTVTYAVTGGTASDPADFSLLGGGTLTFDPGDTTKNIQLSVVNNLLDEDDETVEVTLSAPINASLPLNPVHTYTILDDEPMPTVAFNLTSSQGPESSTPVNLEVRLSTASGRTVTVGYDAIGGTATGGGVDYTLDSDTLTFDPGVTILHIPIAIVDDTVYELDETIPITLLNPINATLGSIPVHTYTIEDNDPAPTLAIDDVSAPEDTGNFTFTVTKTGATEVTATVDFATADGTVLPATGGGACGPGVDYEAQTGTLTFLPTDLSKIITVEVCGDLVHEVNENLFVNLTNPMNAAIGDDRGLGNITNDDPAPTLAIDDVSAAEGNGLMFTVTKTGATELPASVNFATANGMTFPATGSATCGPGADYQTKSGTLTFDPADVTKTITVQVCEDALDEEDETLFVNLTDPLNVTLPDPQGLGTITDDDEPPTVAFNLISSQGPESSTNVNLEVRLSTASGRTVTVDYAATGGTALGGNVDYTLASGTLAFAPGVTVLNIPLTVNDDLLNEAPETVVVTLSAPINATLGAIPVHTYTILNNDPEPTISIDDVSKLEGNSPDTTPFGFTVSLSAPSGQIVTVKYATADGTATTADSDYVGIPLTMLTFPPGETMMPAVVTVNGDNAYEADETFFVNLSYPVNATISDPQGVGTITNDDMQLTVIKTVVNDDGGTKEVADFPLFVDGVPVTSGVPISVAAGLHTVSETGMPGYDQIIGGDCALDGSITLSPGDMGTCTITNDDIQPKLIVIKVVINDNGGTKGIPDFPLFVDGVPVTSGVPIFLNAGAHTVSETGMPGYDQIIGGDCPPDGPIILNPGDMKTCTITNDDIQPLLTVTKIVINDNGGSKMVADFPLFVDGQAVTSGEQNGFNAGPHAITETGDPGYTATFIGDCAPNGSITLSLADVKTCTITNDDIPPQLTVTKVVVNDNGGTKTVADFPLFVNGRGPVTSGVPIFPNAGTYTISETGDPGYTATFGGQCAPDGTITLNPGDVKTCTITNDDIPPQLTVTKLVVNDNGGTKTVADFPLFVNGRGPVLSGVPISPNAGTYTISETGDPGYTAAFRGDCAADGTITLNPGDVKTCTITNNDIQPRLTVTKVVINDHGGTKVVGDFPLFVDGLPVISGAQNGFDAGAHTVTETSVAGYTVTFSGDCAMDGMITLSLGDVKSCTITNNDIQPQLTVTKVVVNDNGGTKLIPDFSLFVDGQPVASGVPIFLNAGPHTVSETPVAGYTATISGNCAVNGTITLSPGDIKACTVTNDDVQARLTVTKVLINDNGGAKGIGDFPLFVDGQPVTSGVPIFLNAGVHTVSETPVAGYTATFGGNCQENGTITLSPGDIKACTVTNDDIQARLTVTKVVVNDNGGTKLIPDFSLFVDGVPVTSGVPVPLNAGPHTVSETPVAGYTATFDVDCGPSGTITLSPGDIMACTVTNDDVQAQLTVTKVLMNDNGGTKLPGDFSLFVDGVPVTSGVPIFLNAGPHTVSETPVAGYTATIGGDCPAHGTITLSPGDIKACTITNNDIQPQLTVTKVVVNDHGGTKVVADFSLFVDGLPATSGVPILLNAGVHTVSETPLAGYTATFDLDCAANGTITLSPGDMKTCTITNDDIQPKLTVIKVVINDHCAVPGYLCLAVVPDFQLFVDGQPVTSGVQNGFNAGPHTITETGPAGYTATFGGDCASNGTITLSPGDMKSCTITNDDIQPLLTITKVVVNDNGGTKLIGDFSLLVDGLPVNPGVQIILPPGLHTVSETPVAGYAATITGDCAANGTITLGLGDVKSCTITNNDIQPRLTVTKIVVNNNGGTKVIGDFPLFVDGQPVTSGVPNGFNTGAHTVSETGDVGYAATIWGDCAANGTITLNLGDVKTCTITNDDISTLSISNVTQAEGHSGTTAFTFTVTKTGATGLIVSVNFATATGMTLPATGGVAPCMAGVDYLTQSGMLTFLPADVTKTITVQVCGDVVYEANETFFVNLSGAVNATISDGLGLGTIENDDAAPALVINDVTQAEGDSGTTNFVFTVTKTGATELPASVDFATANGVIRPATGGGPCMAGIDYLTQNGTLSFLPAEATKTITVQVCGDVVQELNETFFVNLSNPMDAMINDGEGLGTILNDTDVPTLSINNVTMDEGNSGTTDFMFTVTKTGATELTVNVSFATANGTALGNAICGPGFDYESQTGMLSFAPADTFKTATVRVCGDFVYEADETFFVNLLNPVNAIISDGVGLGTITNDDPAPLQPQLTVIKVVVNDNGGTKVVADFPLFVDGQPVISGAQNGFNAGAHTVSETGRAGYAATFSGDCSAYGTITLNLGDVKTCTITNDDIAPKLIVIKRVVNNYGANKVASDFTMIVSGTAVPGGSTSFPGAGSPGTTTFLKAGSYSVSESGPSGYSSSFSSYCSSSISLGQTKTCTVTNTAKKGYTPPPPPPPPVPPGCVVSATGVFRNTAFGAQTGSFTAEYDATPARNNVDAVVGLSDGAADGYTDLAVITRFHDNGFIDARNGGDYAAMSSIPFTGGLTYHFRVEVDFVTHTYDAYVRLPGASMYVQIGDNFAFRSERSRTSQLNNWSTTSDIGSQQVCNFVITPALLSPLTSSLSAPTACVQSSSSTWQGAAFTTQTGPFVATYEATPNGSGVDAVVGLSANAATQYEHLAVITRFDNNGLIDARDGGTYAAVAPIPYLAGVTYRFRAVVNLATKRYDAYVTPLGGAEIEVQIAANYGFRDEQASVQSLSNWNTLSDIGNQTVCDFALLQPSP